MSTRAHAIFIHGLLSCVLLCACVCVCFCIFVSVFFSYFLSAFPLKVNGSFAGAHSHTDFSVVQMKSTLCSLCKGSFGSPKRSFDRISKTIYPVQKYFTFYVYVYVIVSARARAPFSLCTLSLWLALSLSLCLACRGFSYAAKINGQKIATSYNLGSIRSSEKVGIWDMRVQTENNITNVCVWLLLLLLQFFLLLLCSFFRNNEYEP